MSEMRAITNIIGNGVATVVVSKWENEFDAQRAERILNGETIEDEPLLSETEIGDAKIDGEKEIGENF